MEKIGIRTGKGAPAATLGLLLFFLFFTLPSFCGALEELSLFGRIGNLWVEAEGSAWYWLSGFSYRPARSFYLEAAGGDLKSSLPWAETDLSMFFLKSGVDFKWFGLHVQWASFRAGYSELELGNVEFYNQGGEAGFFGVSLPLYLGPFMVAPSFLSGSARFNDGSLYWFFGKPLVPRLYGYGLAAGYTGIHRLELRYLGAEPEIRSNDDEGLIATDLNIFLASYALKLGPAASKPEAGRRRFEGRAGLLYAEGSAEGSLTASNQHYVLFPFSFFTVSGSLKAHIAFGLVRLLFQPSFFQFDITFGVFHVLQGEANADYHFKMKRLFGSSEFQGEVDPIGLDNTGLAFLALDGGIVFRRPYRPEPYTLSLGIQKIFALPWGYEKFIPGASSGGGDSTGTDSPDSPLLDPEVLRTALLSGLSVYVKISR
ncbi:MAG: hypothetical protein LBC62_05855 [Treponema sp.]|jgi:hypothetical protein|nr:hypothetical protein [Treponema sp.]